MEEFDIISLIGKIIINKSGDHMKKIKLKVIFDWLKLLIPSAGLLYLIFTIVDKSFKSHLNAVMSTVLGLYVIVFGLDGIIVKKSRESIYLFYLFIGVLILIFNYRFAF